jgi:hypothetical protein
MSEIDANYFAAVLKLYAQCADIEQIDVVACEDERTTMLYGYTPEGDCYLASYVAAHGRAKR